MSCTQTEFKSVPVNPPLAKMNATVYDGQTHEIFATLASGVKIGDVIEFGLFEGFDPRMTLEAAQQRLGPPTGQWDDPFCGREIPYYQRPGGRVSLCRYGTSGADRWDTVGYPQQCDHDHVFRDPRLPRQIASWLPDSNGIDVHVLRQIGFGGVTVRMSKSGCSWVVFSDRE